MKPKFKVGDRIRRINSSFYFKHWKYSEAIVAHITETTGLYCLTYPYSEDPEERFLWGPESHLEDQWVDAKSGLDYILEEIE